MGHPLEAAKMSEEMPNLDLLRTIAVSLVVVGHLTFHFGVMNIGPFRLTRIGQLGVLFFFVHTCCVLMMSLERQWKGQSPLQLFGSFITRRIFRIYPLSIAVVALIVIFHLPQAFVMPGYFQGAVLSAGTILSNLTLVNISGPWILGVLWSLPYEMAMYFFLPWIFLFILDQRSWHLRVVGLWLIAVAGTIVILQILGWPGRDYFVEYVPCFFPGVIAYRLMRATGANGVGAGRVSGDAGDLRAGGSRGAVLPGRRPLPALLWIVVVGSVVPLYMYRRELLGNWCFRNWLVCLVIGLAIPLFSQISQKWITIPSHYIAKYSYGIYLTHFFCIWLAFDQLHRVLPKIARLGVFVVLAAGLPILFYHLLEEPMILVGKRCAKRLEAAYETRIASRTMVADAETP